MQLQSTTNIDVAHTNGINTFLPPSDKATTKVESNTKATIKDEPLIKVKHTQTTDKDTK